jgi:hypothetical protein
LRLFLPVALALALAPSASAAGLVKTPPFLATTPPNLAEARYTLLQVDGRPDELPSFAVRAAGATLVSRSLDVWRVRRDLALRLVPALRRGGALQVAEPDRRLQTFSHLSAGDPLIPQEWWLHDVGADAAEPPGPGVAVTVLDTGLDTSHPEFLGRPNVLLLNGQSVVTNEEIHGTAVSSVVGAPSNGIGLVGVYPQARLREFDFDEALLSDVIAGFDAAARHGRSVINISGGFFGSTSALLERAVDRAIVADSVVVAAVGNDRGNGSRLAIPASLPHVLTIAATDEADRVTSFSSRSAALDLAAPGQDIPVAVPTYYDPSGYATFDGTSFSSPLVAGATAWVWTARPELDNTQILDVMRGSARDVASAGWDRDTGFGVLDIPAALAAPAPPADPDEPNDDVYLVKPRGLTAAGGTPLTAPSRPEGTLRARLDYSEDPEDVYRVWLPARGTVVVRVKGSTNVDLAVWGPKTRTVFEKNAALRRDLLGYSQRRGTSVDVVKVTRRGRRGAYGYVDVFLGTRVPDSSYTLSVSTARR